MATRTDGATTTPPRPPKDAPQNAPEATLRAYIAYRRAQLAAAQAPHGGRLGGAQGVYAQSVNVILHELDALADWLEAGMPAPATVLSETDKEFWRDAKRRGMPVPDEIEAQL